MIIWLLIIIVILLVIRERKLSSALDQFVPVAKKVGDVIEAARKIDSPELKKLIGELDEIAKGIL